MAKRGQKKNIAGRILLSLLVIALALALGVTMAATWVCKLQTGESFGASFGMALRLETNYAINLLRPAGRSVPRNPYRDEDYYNIGALKHCSAGEISKAGIDVSVHQKEIDWAQVKQAGVDFAIVRVGYRGSTEGGIFADTNAQENIEGALAAGLDVGVYFFSQATSAREAREEARFVLDAIRNYDITYPVFYDWEGMENDARTDRVSGEEMTDFAKAFCEEVKSGGYTPGVYFNQSYGYNRFDLYDLRDYEFWLAEYSGAQRFAYEVQLWQYDCEAHLPGIETTVDLNLCHRIYPMAPENDQ